MSCFADDAKHSNDRVIGGCAESGLDTIMQEVQPEGLDIWSTQAL